MTLPRACLLLALIGSAALTAHVLGIASASDDRGLLLNIVGWSIAALAALAWSGLAASRVEPGRIRNAWAAWTIGCAAFLAGALVRIGMVADPANVAAWRRAADILWLVASVIIAVGFTSRVPRNVLSLGLVLLDALPLAFLGAGVAAIGAGRGIWPLVLAAVFGGVFLLLSLLGVQNLLVNRSFRVNVVLLAVTLGVLGIAGVLWALHGVGQPPHADTGDVLWSIGMLVLAATGTVRALSPAGYTRLDTPRRDSWWRPLPGLAAVATLVALDAVEIASGSRDALLTVLVVVSMGAVALRFLVVYRREAAVADELEESERRYRTLVEELPLVTYIDALDDRSSNIYTSPQIEALLGYTADEWQSDPELFVRLLHPDDRERVLAEIARTNASGERFRGEYRLVARDGSVVWFRDESVAVLDSSGRPLYCQGYLLDITDRHLAEEELRTANEVLRGVVENSPAAIVGFDREGNVMMWNPGAERTFGWSREEVIDRFNPLVPESSRDEFRSFVALALTGKSWRDVEIVRQDKGGRRVHLSASSAPLRNGQGEPIGMVSVLLDITERKLVEEELALERQLMAAFMATTPDHVYFKDRESRFIRISDALVRWFGLESAEGAIGKTDFDFFTGEHAAPQFAAEQEITRSGKPVLDVEQRETWLDGRETWVVSSKMPLRDVDGEIIGTYGISRDITDCKRAEQEREELLRRLAEQNEQLRQVDAMKDEFVALVSHELRTPLTSIIGYVELTRDEGELSEDQSYFLEVVERNSQRLLRLVSDLLFVAQVQAGKLNLEIGVVELDSIVRESVEGARPRAAGKEVGLHLEAAPVRPCPGDAARLAQVVDNLISNAIKFTPEGGSVTVRLGERGDTVSVEVADTGVGVPEAERHQLFERFFRTTTVQHLAIQGTGLGLPITKAIVEGHGGAIGFESEEGVGTTFRVDLPLGAAGPSEWGLPVVGSGTRSP